MPMAHTIAQLVPDVMPMAAPMPAEMVMLSQAVAPLAVMAMSCSIAIFTATFPSAVRYPALFKDPLLELPPEIL